MTATPKKTVLLPWKCPRCGAPAGKHGRGGETACHEAGGSACQGLICECDGPDTKEHGRTYGDPCEQAACYHCGWGGTYPGKPPSEWPEWAKKAAKAGWTPPAGWKGASS